MFQDFLYDIFGLLLGDKILTVVLLLGSLITINGLMLSCFYYREARKRIGEKILGLPKDVAQIMILRRSALKGRKSNIDDHSVYIASNLQLFESIDELVSDGKIQVSSYSVNTSFGFYKILAPFEIIPRLGRWAMLGIKLFIIGQIILAVALPGGVIGGLVTVGALVVNAVLSARYESILNSIQLNSSKNSIATG